MVLIRLAEVEGGNSPEPAGVLNVKRPVEPVQFLGLFDHLAVDRLGPDPLPPQLLQLEGDRIPRRELDDEKGDQRDSEKGRDNQ